MKQLANAGFRSLGMFLVVVGAVMAEKLFDEMELVNPNFMPFGVLLFGLILFYSVRD